jgi:outer membrane lipoprotein-sorting protein
MKTFKFALILLLSPLAFAQKAEDILDKAAEALGGAHAADSLKSMVISATMTLPNGLDAKSIIYQEGNKIFAKVEVSGMEQVMGCDGTDCYANDPMGLRLLEGKEKDNFLMQNDFSMGVKWRDFYTRYEYKGDGEVDGHKTYTLELETQTGMVVTSDYDAETYLCLRQAGTISGPMGDIQYVAKFMDYQDAHQGFMVPRKVRMNAMNMDMDMNVQEIEVNVDIPDDKFALPPGLK